ncbi:MAG: hypothetical protein NVS3B2_09260 [Ramlibacter sp.]
MANAQSAGGLVQRPEWTLYAGHGVDANLLGIPKQIFSNDVKFEPSYFTPTYEDGPDSDPTRRYRFQNFTAIELEGGLNQLPETSLVARIHHRSVLYGLIAPKHVGSNFLTVGIRHRF